MSQGERKSLTCVQINQKKEQLFNLLDAQHAEGMRAGFKPKLTSIMLSRARFVNACSIEVDILMRGPKHTKDAMKKLCAW